MHIVRIERENDSSHGCKFVSCFQGLTATSTETTSDDEMDSIDLANIERIMSRSVRLFSISRAQLESVSMFRCKMPNGVFLN